MATFITELAYADLEGICDFLLPQYAEFWELLHSEFRRTFRLLGRQPRLGTDRRRYGVGLRSVTVRGYVVYFRRANGRTEIVRIIHGARDIDAAFFDDSTT
jgi:toxin ParE1/3/4